MARARTVSVRDRRWFEYVADGAGRATLLVHPGGPGFTYHYLRLLLKLATSHLRVVLFNPRGVGHSWAPKRAGEYTVEQQAEDIESIRRALDIKELHLLGFSAGGFAALEYAHRYEDKLTSLLLCDTAGSAQETRAALQMMRQAAPEPLRRRLREVEKTRKFESPEYQQVVDRITAPWSHGFVHPVPRELEPKYLSKSVYRAMMTRTGDEFKVDGSFARWDGRKYYAQIEVPTVVVVGRYDYFLEASREMADRIVPAHLRVLPHSSHLPQYEEPNSFLKTLREFLIDVTGD
ncbi:MAG TPA: alpha/beta hydrolase [Thermoplasmata archaeon]|nr:alpha/beta hydrolase [Thermoplasmata archaeon]